MEMRHAEEARLAAAKEQEIREEVSLLISCVIARALAPCGTPHALSVFVQAHAWTCT